MRHGRVRGGVHEVIRPANLETRRTEKKMTKSMITKLFVGGLIAIVGGLVLSIGAGLAAYAGGALIMSGPDVIGVESTPIAWTMLALAILGYVVMFGGGITQLIAWIVAVLFTSLLQDKTCFGFVLMLGSLSVAFVTMLLYVLAGSDGTAEQMSATHVSNGLSTV